MYALICSNVLGNVLNTEYFRTKDEALWYVENNRSKGFDYSYKLQTWKPAEAWENTDRPSLLAITERGFEFDGPIYFSGAESFLHFVHHFCDGFFIASVTKLVLVEEQSI